MNRGDGRAVNYRLTSAKRACLLVLAVFGFSFGLVGFSSLPGGPEPESAEAHHCDEATDGPLCGIGHYLIAVCNQGGGTMVDWTCVYPTTTQSTSCPLGYYWEWEWNACRRLPTTTTSRPTTTQSTSPDYS